MSQQPTAVWKMANGRELSLYRHRILGILNVTPDSFSDGGQFNDVSRAVERAREMLAEGADMLDIGGESTRPGADRVTEEEQIRRVAPVIEALRRAGIEAPISVDTTRARVAEAALGAGADAINDVSAGLEDDRMFTLAREWSAGLILMHRKVAPGVDVYSHQHVSAPDYDSQGGVVEAVIAFLRARVDAARRSGVEEERIVIDPGLGFGKSVEQNFALIAGASRLAAVGPPQLSAASRKSFLGAVTGAADPASRVIPSVSVTVAHATVGVRLFRVHDVGAHAQALAVVRSLERVKRP